MTKIELKKQFLILNKTRKQISEEFGLSLNQIQYLLTKYDLHKDLNRSEKVKITKQHASHISTKLLDKDWLYNEYITKNKTRIQIANELKVSESLIKKKLIYFNIKKPVTLYHKNTVKGCKDKQMEIKKKREITMKKRYGVKNYTTHKDFQVKARKSLNKHHSWNTSKAEDTIYGFLIEKFKKVKRQYNSKQYPFNCDFYIPSLKLYIEYQGTWTHGKMPYDKNNRLCKNILSTWKTKAKLLGNNSQYNSAIEVWTRRDPLKRQTAKENSLNWIEFFNMKEFEEWYNGI